MADVVKCSVFLGDGIGNHKPARTTVESKFADPKMKVEIDCIAYKPKK